MSQLIVDKLQINTQLSIPQYTEAQRNSLSPVQGTLIYLTNTDEAGLQVWSGTEWVGLAGGSGLYDFINATFNNGSKTGAEGPTLSQARQSMSGQGIDQWNNNSLYYNVDSNGVQSWTVPKSGTYRFLVAGAKGGEGNAISNNISRTAGRGAVMRGDWALEEGQVFNIIAGVKPATAGEGGGGGGGSFVWSAADGSPLIVAGGGGGNGDVYYGTIAQSAGDDGNASGTSGTEPNSGGGSLGGQNGQGGSVNNNDGGPGAGGGFLTAGASGTSGAGGGNAAVNGGKGGQADNNNSNSLTTNAGGHGGGGGESFNGNDAEGAGGGGGYSGGGASGSGDPGGGGGGSFLKDGGSNYGTSTGSWSTTGGEPHAVYTGSVDSLNQFNTGQGYVTVTFIS